MIPTWMGIEKVVQEMGSVRRHVGAPTGDQVLDQALSEADLKVRPLSLESDAEAVRQAWRAVSHAEQAVGSAIRFASPRRRAR